MKKIIIFIGMTSFIIGVFLLLNSLSNLTGFIISESFPILQSKVLGLVFLLIGLVSMAFSRGDTEVGSELEEKLGYGKDVEIHAIFVRHGEKDKEGQLTYQGREQAKAYGRNLGKRKAIKGYSSSVQRVIDTTEEIIEAAPHDKKLKTRIRELTNPGFSKKFIEEYMRHYEKSPDAAADWYFELGKKRFDESNPTTQELAESFAYIVQKDIRMSNRLYSGSKVDLVVGTHQNLPECLLKEVLIRDVDGKSVRGFDSVKEIGGLLEYAEQVDFVIKRDSERETHIKVEFRGKEYDVDMKRLNQLANNYARKIKRK